jgi:hypothetical protein
MADNIHVNKSSANVSNETNDAKTAGKQSVAFKNPPYIIAAASIAGKKREKALLGICLIR